MVAAAERVNLVLNGIKTVRVRTVDSANKPVPGVEIAATSIIKKQKLSSISLFDSRLRVRTDNAGIATFDWLPADQSGRASFTVATPSYSTLERLAFDFSRA